MFGGTRVSGSLGCSNVFEPIGLLYLAAWIEEKCNAEAHVIQQGDLDDSQLLERIISEAPELVGFTTLTVTINSILKLAAALKERLPETIIVLGGEHVTAVPELAAEPQVDYVVRNEGEKPLAALIEFLEGKRELSQVPSISYYRNGLVHNPTDSEPVDFDAVPFPKRDLSLLHNCRVGGLMHPHMSNQRNVAVVTASRGCPNDCTFCTNALMWNRNLRLRTPSRVADEMEALHEGFGTNTIFFADLSFNASSKYTEALCQEIAARRLPVSWYAMCNLHLVTNQMAAMMAEAGCRKIGFGVESMVSDHMRKAKKGISLELDEINQRLDMVNSCGIFSKAYFIIGFPWETKQDLQMMADLLPELEAHEIRIGYYVPFRGTRGYDQHKDLIEDWNLDHWSCLDGPVVRNRDIPRQDLVQLRERMYRSFYGSAFWIERIETMSCRFPHLRESIDAFWDNDAACLLPEASRRIRLCHV
jgi:radical SAM superfamily enzyme YgiQ (UPF0313 family)